MEADSVCAGKAIGRTTTREFDLFAEAGRRCVAAEDATDGESAGTEDGFCSGVGSGRATGRTTTRGFGLLVEADVVVEDEGTSAGFPDEGRLEELRYALAASIGGRNCDVNRRCVFVASVLVFWKSVLGCAGAPPVGRRMRCARLEREKAAHKVGPASWAGLPRA